MSTYSSPRLIADIGGTFARFALETAPGQFSRQASLRCADHADFHAAMRAYLDQIVEDEYLRNKIRELQGQLRDIQKVSDA